VISQLILPASRLQRPQVQLAADLEQARDAGGVDHDVIIRHHDGIIAGEHIRPLLITVMQVLKLRAPAADIVGGELLEHSRPIAVVHYPQIEIPPALQPTAQV
jgi:hypothetical protein